MEVRLDGMIFFRHYLVVHFGLPMKKLCLRFVFVWCRGDVGGKTPPNYFLQALPSGALYVAREETMSLRFDVTWSRGNIGGKNRPNYFLQALPSGALLLCVKRLRFRIEVT